MRLTLCIAACSLLALPFGAAQGLMLVPGVFGYANGVGIGASGTVLASNATTFYEATSDVGIPDDFLTSVTHLSTGQLAFTYQLTPDFDSFVSVPASLTLSGFSGVSTDVYVLAGTGNESANWQASRSADGSTLTLARIGGTVPGNPTVDVFTVEVVTDATGYIYNPDAYLTHYWGFSNVPPPSLNLPMLGHDTVAAYSPNIVASESVPVVPEPLTILTLPLALLAMGWRFRRGTAAKTEPAA